MADYEVFTFADAKVNADQFYEYDKTAQKNVPIIIDNGSYQCRAGFASVENPQLIFKNIIAKQRGRKAQQQDGETLIGNDIHNIEAVRSSLKSQFDKNVVTQYDVQEQIFDYIFTHLGINIEGGVNHPMVLTEAPANPLCCRNNMTELLFETYSVPSILYGIDAMFSLYQNKLHTDHLHDSLVISLGYQTMHVLPVLRGSVDIARTRRVNLGGAQLEYFMHRLLQLKYPEHLSALTASRAEEIIHRHCHISSEYLDELRKWSDVPYYTEHVHQLQLPFNKVAAPVVQSAEQIRDKRELQVKRLRQIHRKKREEKLAANSEKLQKMTLMRDLLDEGQNVSLSEFGYSSKDDLLAEIDDLMAVVDKLTNALSENQGGQEESTKSKTSKDSSSKSKKIKTEKSLESEDMERRRQEDFPGWLEDMRIRRQAILDKRNDRQRHRDDMSKRKTLAAQQRMRKLTKLAAGEKSKKNKPDTFGMKDSDWDIYKEINRHNDDSDSDSDADNLNEIDALLSLYDPQMQNSGLSEGSGEVDIAERYRIHVAVEQIRVPELMFQPSMIGEPQSGLGETIDHVLKLFTPDEQDRLVQYVYVTGGLAKLPTLKDRLENELREMRPFQSTFSIHMADDTILDAWYGARKFASTPASSTLAITRSFYQEYGQDYLKDHPLKGTAFVPKSVLV